MLSLLTGAPHSAAELARELGGSQANASYHERRLEHAGLVVVVEQLSVGGVQARRYHTWPPTARGTVVGFCDTRPGLARDPAQVRLASCPGAHAKLCLRDIGPKTDVLVTST